MNNKSTIIEIDADHQVWKNELNDMKEEIADMQAILSCEVFKNKTLKKEHFKNLFSIHKLEIEHIINRIKKSKLHNNKIVGSGFELVDEKEYSYHRTIGIMVDKQSELFRKIKLEFQETKNITKPVL